MAQGDGGEWLTVSEAARRLGVSRQALQYKIKKGKVEHRQDNRGNPMVRFAAMTQDLAANFSGANGASPCAKDFAPDGPRMPQDASESVLLSVHRETIEALQATHRAALEAIHGQIKQIRDDAASQRADMEFERQRHDAEVERLVGQFSAERAFWCERSDAAEVRAELAEQRVTDMARQMVEQADRPWWSKWFGASKKSEISR